MDKDVSSFSIPDGVTSIGNEALSGCTDLTGITIPDCVTNIGEYAFSGCTGLAGITIPDNVTNIDMRAFSGCTSLTSITIPDSVTSIGDNAFEYCSSLTSVVISENVTRIGDYTFYNCNNLVDVTIPDSVTSIGNYAFQSCSSLASITIPDGVIDIGNYAFQYCYSLTSVTISDSVTNIGPYAFSNCNNLSSIMIPDSVTSIGESAFDYWRVKMFAHMDSYAAKKLSRENYTFRVPETNYDLCYLFADDEISGLEIRNVDKDITSFSIPDGIISIGEGAFSGCTSLTGITIPDSVTSIGDNAFYNCKGLTSITIPDGVTSIDWYTFYSCTSLTSITIPDSVTSIGEGAFCNCCSLPGITIPDGVTSISADAFVNCPAKLVAHLNTDGAKAISKIGYSFRVPGNNYDLCYLFDNDEISGLEIRSVDKDVSSFLIPDGITSIGSYAFFDCSSLTDITIPDGVTSIGECAFAGCTSLISTTIPDSVTSIGISAFSGCISLVGITIPDSVTVIGQSAFYSCRSLVSVTIPASVTRIGGDAFLACTSLTKALFFGESTTFGYSVFYNIYPFPTIYCYEYSDVDFWAAESHYPVVYLDGIDLEDLLTITLQEDFTLGCGQSTPVGFNIFPNIEHPNIVWSSSAPEIVSVENGIATANAPGTATITATMGNTSDTLEITTYLVAEAFELNTEECWIIAKNDAQLAVARVIPEGAEVSFTWTSSDIAIATVDENGLVSTKKPGDVMISVDSDNGMHRECVVHSCYPVTAVSFAEENLTVHPGFSRQLTANVTMRSQSCVNHLVSFASSDENVATVDENGLVTPHEIGTATITATADNGVSASCTVIVREITYTVLPADLKNIEDEAFRGLALEAVIIPDGCESIGSYAFADCPDLMYVSIPASVTSISDDAFDGCPNVVIDIPEE